MLRFSPALFSTLLLGVTGLGAFSVQVPSVAAAAEPSPINFTFRLAGEPETLDWNRAHTPIETYVLMNLMEGLVAFDSRLQVVPALAQSYTKSADGLIYTFKLRPGVKWQDGVALKAQDFVFSWKRLLSPLTAASYAYFLFDIVGAEDFNKGALTDFEKVGVQALDDSRLQVKLRRPVAHWIQIPTFWVTFPLRRDVVEKHGDGWATPGRMLTLGPYTLASYDLDSRIVLKANPAYYGKSGNIAQATALIVKDESAAMNLYEVGKIDFLTDIGTVDLQRVSGRSDLKSFPYLKTAYLGFVVGKYPASNVAFRRAVAMSIDKTKIHQILFGGQQPAPSFVPPGLLGHSSKVGLPFDPVRAKAELKRSGMDPATVRAEIVVPNWDKARTLAQFLQQELKKHLGIRIEIQSFDHKTFRAQLDLRIFPMFLSSWSADYPDADNFASVFLSGAGNNRGGWASPKFDSQVLKARSLAIPKERERLYLEAQKLLLDEDVVMVPLYYEPNLALVRPRVKGLELSPLNYLFLKNVTVETAVSE